VNARERIRATYRIAVSPGEEPEERARALAWEQTAELSPGSRAPGLRRGATGRVEGWSPLSGEEEGGGPGRPSGRGTPGKGRGEWGLGDPGEALAASGIAVRAVLSYPGEAAGGEIAQLLNLLWGNASLQEGIALEDVELPGTVVDRFPGPARGIGGIRDATGVGPGRPLLCAALKPLGASPAELAGTARRFAEGGAHLIKDDHSLTDQSWAPFRERVHRCAEAVAEANARTGRSCLYLPHVTGAPGLIAERIGRARELGCRGVLVNALPAGLPVLSQLASQGEVFLLAHPSGAGGFLGRDRGIAPELLFGTLFRLAGADGVIYPNVGGRFPFGLETCRRIHHRLREPLGRARAAFPVLGGGIDVARIPRWVEAYGSDTIFLVGGSLYEQPDLTAATRRLVNLLEAGDREGAREGSS